MFWNLASLSIITDSLRILFFSILAKKSHDVVSQTLLCVFQCDYFLNSLYSKLLLSFYEKMDVKFVSLESRKIEAWI